MSGSSAQLSPGALKRKHDALGSPTANGSVTPSSNHAGPSTLPSPGPGPSVQPTTAQTASASVTQAAGVTSAGTTAPLSPSSAIDAPGPVPETTIPHAEPSSFTEFVDLTEPRRYLVIDGGGTKTTALLAVVDPEAGGPVFYRSEAGPSNLTTGLDPCLASITSATLSVLLQAHNAASSADSAFPPPPGFDDSPSPPFGGSHALASVWAGVAGCARPSDQALLGPKLRDLFPGAAVRLTSDAELLTSTLLLAASGITSPPPSEPTVNGAQSGSDPGPRSLTGFHLPAALIGPGGSHKPVKRAVTLVCGTGCLAIAWSLSRGKRGRPSAPGSLPGGVDGSTVGGWTIRQDGRSGGWGPLLGDEGSGFSLGKAAIRDVLHRHANKMTLSEWHRDLLRGYGTKDPGALIPLVARLETGVPHALADARRKGRIAACCRPVVLAASGGEASALGVLRRVAREVLDVLRPLIEEGEVRDRLGETMLVIGGGLGGNDTFWGLVQDGMRGEGWVWGGGVQRVREREVGERAMEVLMRGAEGELGDPTEGERKVKQEKKPKINGAGGSGAGQGAQGGKEAGINAPPPEKKKRVRRKKDQDAAVPSTQDEHAPQSGLPTSSTAGLPS